MRYASYLSAEDQTVLNELRIMLAVYGNSSEAVHARLVEILNDHCGPEWFVSVDEVPVVTPRANTLGHENAGLRDEIVRLHKELAVMTKSRDFLRGCMQNHLRNYRENEARKINPEIVPMDDDTYNEPEESSE